MQGLPAKYLSRIGNQEVEIEGVKVKTCHLTDNTAVIDNKIQQLRAALSGRRPVVGVDVKVTMGDQEKQQNKTADLLILFGGNYSLVINLAYLTNTLSSIICNFLNDNNICFVSTGLRGKLGGAYLQGASISLGRVVEVGDLVERVLKKPKLSKCGLKELHKLVRKSTVTTDLPDQTYPPEPDTKAGVSTSPLPGTSDGGACPNWKAKVFTDEEMKYAIHDAYVCYVIGDAMLGILDAVEY